MSRLSRSRTRDTTPTSSEAGSANLIGFMAALVILLPAFLLFMFFNGAKTARTEFDFQVINTAKAAASQTFTTDAGELRVDCVRAQAAALDAYGKFRQVNRDQFGYRLMAAPTYTVATTCPEAAAGAGASTVTVKVIDEYTGALLTAGYFPTLALTGGAEAALHDSSSFGSLDYVCTGPGCIRWTPEATG